jgi:hypothetical protein
MRAQPGVMLAKDSLATQKPDCQLAALSVADIGQTSLDSHYKRLQFDLLGKCTCGVWLDYVEVHAISYVAFTV